jgi:uncharacterized protein (DUF433 family)
MRDIDRIVIDPKMLVGKPVIRGTRIAVEFIIELLWRGVDREPDSGELSAS